MGKSTGRSKLFEKFDEHIEKDYDPEAEQVVASGSEDDSGDENAGTEHYVNVGKSKLRDKGDSSLGPKYRGSKVSRSALERESSDEEAEAEDDDDDSSEEYDDPETANLEADTAEASDSEISSDEALGESDNEKLSKFVFRGSSNPKRPKSKRATAADFMSDSVEEIEDDEEDDEEDDDMDDGLEALVDGEAEESGDDDDDDEDEDEDDEDEDEEDEDEEDEDEENRDGRDEKRSDAKAAANGRTPNADIEKGAAIQKQRKLYDGLLNLRIRLQKALIAANTFSALEDEEEEDDGTTTASYDAAEATALSLLNTISCLRENCGAPAVAGTKRKRSYEVSATSAEIWAQLQEEDRHALKFRERCLEKWSRKVQSVNVTAPKGLNRNKTLVESLHDQLNNPENRLAKRTRVPRSCAPAQHAKKMPEDETIFDDADFYQILLKELVEQRTVDSSSNQASDVPSVVLTASRENRTRKVVDRKASKGRKMRFTVHEKLQNFMASEDRRQWEQSAIDRFFSTLFGRKLEFNEDEVDEDEVMADVADPNFKLFA
ncbi:hypothetical protein LLEC1_01626 [Akanthomyces lecanii]|uniref:Protein BFR2 n=1 Tax=Cordyceps confragosa TaxID=2714763 RepID=A0A179IH99_CORDF|nr:hypothetical protein LLEC1_01626 [Akanthomyces lecanii]